MAAQTKGWFAWYMPSPEERYPMSSKVFAWYALPAYLSYYAMAVLVLLPGTRLYRMVFLPLALYALFRSVAHVDASCGVPEYNHWNYGHGIFNFVAAMRMLEWAFLSRPPQRTPISPNPKDSAVTKPKTSVFTDAVDLTTNLRGLGWDWARGTHVPHETRPTRSALAFLLTTALCFVRDIFVCDALHHLAQSVSPSTFGSPSGGPILDPSLPLLKRYARSSKIVLLGGGTVYFALSMMFNLATLLSGVLHPKTFDPYDWPPFAEAPWAASSLADFWARRWHQSFRRPFLALGGAAGRVLGGGTDAGMVLGAFALSGALHDWSAWGMARGTDYARLGGFFVLNGVGVVLERMWKRMTGYRVHGWGGWMWTMSCLLVTAHMLIGAWLEMGLAGCHLLPSRMRVGKFLVEWTERKLGRVQ
ncbi:hypothetical protein EIP86_001581 [Pleurotus ostreatoroseus]|nr:hypothetical protein EIP86_001581 [Pleurotus ostreatoroseus]